jgi:hypothetical protein
MGAFDAESRRLSEIAAGTDDAAFARPSPCLPWTAGELLYHVQMTMERLGIMLAAPEPAGSGLVTAPGYYRADRRFSAAVNADRIHSAQSGVAAVPGAAARARDFCRARERIWSLLQAAPPQRVVRTRHGDRMLLGPGDPDRQAHRTGPGDSSRDPPGRFPRRPAARPRLGPAAHALAGRRQARERVPGGAGRSPRRARGCAAGRP